MRNGTLITDSVIVIFHESRSHSRPTEAAMQALAQDDAQHGPQGARHQFVKLARVNYYFTNIQVTGIRGMLPLGPARSGY